MGAHIAVKLSEVIYGAGGSWVNASLVLAEDAEGAEALRGMTECRRAAGGGYSGDSGQVGDELEVAPGLE